MKERNGWICLHRDFKNKAIWANGTIEQRIIFIILLTMANHSPNSWEWKGKQYTVQAGQFVTSVKSIVQECNCKEITDRKVRTALERFKMLGFLTFETSNKNTLITIVNWYKYQNMDFTSAMQSNVNQMSNKCKTNVKQMSTNNNVNNDNNDNNDNKSISISNDIDYRADAQKIFTEWNSLEIYGINPVVKITAGTKRYKSLNARIKQYGLDAVLTAIDNIRSSDFLQGKNKNGWVISFDWFVLPNNFIKVLERKYNNTVSQSNKTESTGNPFFDMLHKIEDEERKEKGDIIDV